MTLKNTTDKNALMKTAISLFVHYHMNVVVKAKQFGCKHGLVSKRFQPQGSSNSIMHDTRTESTTDQVLSVTRLD